MPTSYKLEVSPNNRAACKSPLCKDLQVKLMKGELRLGSYLTIRDHGSWAFRHWGCATPEVIKNIANHIEGNPEIIEGWEDLDSDIQATVERALDQGHVDDDVWKGDPEFNRPGMKGMFKKAPKPRRKRDPETGEFIEPASTQDDGEAEKAEEPKANGKKPRKSPKATGQAIDHSSEIDQDIKPVRKRTKKEVKDEEATVTEDEREPVAKPTRKRKAVKREDDDDQAVAPAKPARKARPKKIKPEPEESDAAIESEEEIPEVKPKIRATRGRKKVVKEEAREDEVEETAMEAPKQKANKGRKRKPVSPPPDPSVALEGPGGDVESSFEEPAPKKVRKGRKKAT